MPIRELLTEARIQTQKMSKRAWLKVAGPDLVSAQTQSDREFLSHFALDEVSRRVAQDDVSGAKVALLAHYNGRQSPEWPAPPDSISDLEVNLADLSRGDLLALADRLLDRPFLPDLAELEINQNGRIDWTYNPTPDPELIWALNRHAWWAIWGLAYVETNDERYAARFVAQMLDWVANNPPPAHKDEKSPTWRLMEVGMRLRVSWIPSFGIFYDSPSFSDDAKLTMLRAIWDHAQFLAIFYTNRNHFLRESNGLAYAGVYFPEFKQAGHWRDTALDRLDQALTEQVNQDGSHIEVATGYQWLAVDEFQHTFDLLQANGISLPNQDLSRWLADMYRVLANLTRPDGTFPQINDGFIFWKRELLAQAGHKLGRDDLVYVGTDGRRGRSPGETSVAFENAGFYVMRSEWARHGHYLLFDAGPYGGPHGHEDMLSFELCAFGQPMIVDPGSYTYDRSNPFRNYFVSSEGHNTVLVDDQSQIRRWYKRHLNPQPEPGNFARWTSQAEFDYVCASYDDGYASFQLKRPPRPKIDRTVGHTRRILFVKPDYWLMVDALRASGPHTYQILYHAAPDVVVTVEPDRRAILRARLQPGPTAGNIARSVSVCLVPSEPDLVTVTCLTGSEDPIQGWYSAGFDHKTPATTVIYEHRGQASTTLATLLYPCRTDQVASGLSFKPLAVTGGPGRAFVVSHAQGQDYLLFGQDDSLKEFGPFQAQGIIAGVRTDSDGKVRKRFEWRA
jgi:hypothetical protein